MFEPLDVCSFRHFVQCLLVSVETMRGWVTWLRMSPHSIKRFFVYLCRDWGKKEHVNISVRGHTLPLVVVFSMTDMVSTLRTMVTSTVSENFARSRNRSILLPSDSCNGSILDLWGKSLR